MKTKATQECRRIDAIDTRLPCWLCAEYTGQLYCYLNFMNAGYQRKRLKLDQEIIYEVHDANAGKHILRLYGNGLGNR